LAEQIRFTQQREIGQLTGWLQIADGPVVSPNPMAWMMTDADHHMAMAMPGLASPTGLTRLQRTTGRANEVLSCNS
jgi:hypothetical protein